MATARPPFCGECGTLLTLPKSGRDVVCSVCAFKQPCSVYENVTVVATSQPRAFNKYRPDIERELEAAALNKAAAAVVKEKCTKCGNEEMTFHTMQLRSADEGQTIFYACPRCQYTFSVNA